MCFVVVVDVTPTSLSLLFTVELVGTDYDLKEAKLTRGTTAGKLEDDTVYEVKILTTGEKLKLHGRNLSE